jgi:hypothetical protein
MTAYRFMQAMLIVSIVSPITAALSADYSDAHAIALSHRYGAYTKKGNLAAGQTVVIDTPEGAITCTGGTNRDFTGKEGPEGDRKPRGGARSCHF